MPKLILSPGLPRHERLLALPSDERWAFLVLATISLDRGGRLPDYPIEDLSDALNVGPYARPKHEVHLLIERLKVRGLIVKTDAGPWVNPLAYEEVEP